jgi:hypothetical protein
MTKRTAKTLCNAIGCTFTFDAEYSEFRVNLKGGSIGTLYHTDDIFDAVETAVAMHRRQREFSAFVNTPTGRILHLTVGTRDDNRNLVSLWDDPASRQRGLDDGDRCVDLELTSAQRTQLFGN